VVNGFSVEERNHNPHAGAEIDLQTCGEVLDFPVVTDS
jgi:hypothetical protein